MSRQKQRACAIEDIRHRVPDQVIAKKYGWFPTQIQDIKDHIDRYGGYEEGVDSRPPTHAGP